MANPGFQPAVDGWIARRVKLPEYLQIVEFRLADRTTCLGYRGRFTSRFQWFQEDGTEIFQDVPLWRPIPEVRYAAIPPDDEAHAAARANTTVVSLLPNRAERERNEKADKLIGSCAALITELLALKNEPNFVKPITHTLLNGQSVVSLVPELDNIKRQMDALVGDVENFEQELRGMRKQIHDDHAAKQPNVGKKAPKL